MNTIRKLAICLGLLGMGTGLAGCAIEEIPYPRLSTIKKMKTKILSPEEQDEVMRNLVDEQKKHQKSAISEIERSQ